MYGKHFASMYEGSMVGAGAIPFALMGYVIANYRLDKDVGAQVRLNPVLLSTILGEPVEDIEKGIAYLCSPDPASTTKDEEGRRLVQLGQFDYRVVNGAKYDAIRSAEEKRQANREAKQRERIKKNGVGTPDLPASAVTPKHGFEKPTMEEMKLRGAKMGLPESECEQCWNYYESNGWKVGKNPMRSWYGALSNWKINWQKGIYGSAKPAAANTKSMFEQEVEKVAKSAGVKP